MKKRVKTCKIEVYSERTNLVSNISKVKRAEETFVGNKNKVLHDIKEFLKDANFHGSALSELLNAINRSSKEYIDKNVNSVETTIQVFNQTTGLLYKLDISYDIEDISSLPYRYSVNRKGENRYEKRLIQQYGGGRIGRYKLALSQVSTDKLIDLLSGVIEIEFKSKTSVNMTSSSGLFIIYPREIVLPIAENLKIKLRFKQIRSDFFKRYICITYNGEEIDFSLKEAREITEESIERALKLADKFNEICEIIKDAYNL